MSFFKKAHAAAEDHLSRATSDPAPPDERAAEKEPEKGPPVQLAELAQVRYKGDALHLTGRADADAGLYSGRAASNLARDADSSAEEHYRRVEEMYASMHSHAYSSLEGGPGAAVLRVQCRVKGEKWRMWHRHVVKVPLRRIRTYLDPLAEAEAATGQPPQATSPREGGSPVLRRSSSRTMEVEAPLVELPKEAHIVVLDRDSEAEELGLPVFLQRSRITLGRAARLRVTEEAAPGGDAGGAGSHPLARAARVKVGPLEGGGSVELQAMEEDRDGWVKLLQFLTQLRWAHVDPLFGDKDRGDALCTSTSLSFTVPPSHARGILHDGSSFHVRMRTATEEGVIKKSWEWDSWLNPLARDGGVNFEPRFNPAKTEMRGLPPPVVLDPLWEQKYVLGGALAQTAGELRVFTVAGLSPSCHSLAAKSLGFGVSRVELQVASCHDDGRPISWEEANTSDETAWSTPLVYDVPPEELSSIVLLSGSNWVRSRGLPAVEEALIGQMDRHKKKNLRIVKAFAEDIVEKLQPIYAFKVEPWLAAHPALRLLVGDSREAALRACCRWLLGKAGVALPPAMRRDRPEFDAVAVLDFEGAPIAAFSLPPGGGRREGARADATLTLPPGKRFSVRATVRRSAECQAAARQGDGDGDDAVALAPRRVEVWWQVTQTNEPLDLQEADILAEPAAGTAAGGRVLAAAAADGGGGGDAQAELRFAGTDADGYPLLTDGTAFVLCIEAFEEGAHEPAHFDLELRISDDVPMPTPSPRDGEAAAAAEGSGCESWPPLPFGPAPAVGEMLGLIPDTAAAAALDYRNRAFAAVGLEEAAWGATLRDSPSAAELAAAAERAAFRKVVASGARRLPGVWGAEAVAAWGAAQEARKAKAGDDLLDASLDVLDEVAKVKMVEYWQKSLRAHDAAMRADEVEQGRVRAAKLEAFGQIFEPDAAAVGGEVAVDAAALAGVDMVDVAALLLKRLLKNEWKELVHEDIGPGLLKAAVAAGVLILLNFLATWWAVRSAHYIYQPGGDVAAMQTQLDAQAAQLQEVLALLKATQGTCGGGSP
jgi:hypothetical protein